MYEALTRRVPFDNLMRGAGGGGGGGGAGGADGGPDGGGGPGGGVGGGGPLPMGGLFAIILAVAIQKKRPTLPEWVPGGLADIIRGCWQEDPRSRPTAAQVFARLDALISEEMARRAARAAARGGGRPRISRHFGAGAGATTSGVSGSSVALVPLGSASSSGMPLPSPPPSPAMDPSPGSSSNPPPLAGPLLPPGTAAHPPSPPPPPAPDSRPSPGQPGLMVPGPASRTVSGQAPSARGSATGGPGTSASSLQAVSGPALSSVSQSQSQSQGLGPGLLKGSRTGSGSGSGTGPAPSGPSAAVAAAPTAALVEAAEKIDVYGCTSSSSGSSAGAAAAAAAAAVAAAVAAAAAAARRPFIGIRSIRSIRSTSNVSGSPSAYQPEELRTGSAPSDLRPGPPGATATKSPTAERGLITASTPPLAAAAAAAGSAGGPSNPVGAVPALLPSTPPSPLPPSLFPPDAPPSAHPPPPPSPPQQRSSQDAGPPLARALHPLVASQRTGGSASTSALPPAPTAAAPPAPQPSGLSLSQMAAAVFGAVGMSAGWAGGGGGDGRSVAASSGSEGNLMAAAAADNEGPITGLSHAESVASAPMTASTATPPPRAPGFPPGDVASYGRTEVPASHPTPTSSSHHGTTPQRPGVPGAAMGSVGPAALVSGSVSFPREAVTTAAGFEDATAASKPEPSCAAVAAAGPGALGPLGAAALPLHPGSASGSPSSSGEESVARHRSRPRFGLWRTARGLDASSADPAHLNHPHDQNQQQQQQHLEPPLDHIPAERFFSAKSRHDPASEEYLTGDEGEVESDPQDGSPGAAARSRRHSRRMSPPWHGPVPPYGYQVPGGRASGRTSGAVSRTATDELAAGGVPRRFTGRMMNNSGRAAGGGDAVGGGNGEPHKAWVGPQESPDSTTNATSRGLGSGGSGQTPAVQLVRRMSPLGGVAVGAMSAAVVNGGVSGTGWCVPEDSRLSGTNYGTGNTAAGSHGSRAGPNGGCTGGLGSGNRLSSGGGNNGGNSGSGSRGSGSVAAGSAFRWWPSWLWRRVAASEPPSPPQPVPPQPGGQPRRESSPARPPYRHQPASWDSRSQPPGSGHGGSYHRAGTSPIPTRALPSGGQPTVAAGVLGGTPYDGATGTTTAGMGSGAGAASSPSLPHSPPLGGFCSGSGSTSVCSPEVSPGPSRTTTTGTACYSTRTFSTGAAFPPSSYQYPYPYGYGYPSGAQQHTPSPPSVPYQRSPPYGMWGSPISHVQPAAQSALSPASSAADALSSLAPLASPPLPQQQRSPGVTVVVGAKQTTGVGLAPGCVPPSLPGAEVLHARTATAGGQEPVACGVGMAKGQGQGGESRLLVGMEREREQVAGANEWGCVPSEGGKLMTGEVAGA